MMRTVDQNDSEERLVSLRRVRSKNPYRDYLVPKYSQRIYSYYYPDSILNRKEYLDYTYDKSTGNYAEAGFETIYFQRKTPYIPPIDTSIFSPIQLSQIYTHRSVRPQVIAFSDSSRFKMSSQGMSTSTMAGPRSVVLGKYHLMDDRLVLYTQKHNSLEIDSAVFTYSTDSLILTTESDLFRRRYDLKLF